MENQEIQKDDSTRELKFKESWKPFWGSALLFAAIILGLFGAFMFFVVGEDWWEFLFVYLFSLLSLGLLVFLCFILPKIVRPKEFTFLVSDRFIVKRNGKTIVDVPKENLKYEFYSFSVWSIGGESLILRWPDQNSKKGRTHKKVIGMHHIKAEDLNSLDRFIRRYC